jgi:hypothetical protein
VPPVPVVRAAAMQKPAGTPLLMTHHLMGEAGSAPSSSLLTRHAGANGRNARTAGRRGRRHLNPWLAPPERRSMRHERQLWERHERRLARHREHRRTKKAARHAGLCQSQCRLAGVSSIRLAASGRLADPDQKVPALTKQTSRDRVTRRSHLAFHFVI